eukprot:13136910-Alexandrium_andersonii.AAC.1
MAKEELEEEAEKAEAEAKRAEKEALTAGEKTEKWEKAMKLARRCLRASRGVGTTCRLDSLAT